MFSISPKVAARCSAMLCFVVIGGAIAHPGHVDSSVSSMSLLEGFKHPFTGVDHLLAMLSVGLWSVQNRRSGVWLLPLMFPLMMIVGALAAFGGVDIAGAETGIAASVAVLGLLIAFAVKMPLWGSTSVISFFALFHGYAHGIELPEGVSAVNYGMGFVAGTALLQAVGVAIGLAARRCAMETLVRCGGVGIAAIGACLLTGF